MKECKHAWRYVYYGSEQDVECSKCNADLWQTYTRQDAMEIIEAL